MTGQTLLGGNRHRRDRGAQDGTRYCHASQLCNFKVPLSVEGCGD